MVASSRKLGQRVRRRVGQDVRITVVKIDRNSVRIGIEAPHDVTVYREEIVPMELDLAFDLDLELDEEHRPSTGTFAERGHGLTPSRTIGRTLPHAVLGCSGLARSSSTRHVFF